MAAFGITTVIAKAFHGQKETNGSGVRK